MPRWMGMGKLSSGSAAASRSGVGDRDADDATGTRWVCDPYSSRAAAAPVRRGHLEARVLAALRPGGRGVCRTGLGGGGLHDVVALAAGHELIDDLTRRRGRRDR